MEFLRLEVCCIDLIVQIAKFRKCNHIGNTVSMLKTIFNAMLLLITRVWKDKQNDSVLRLVHIWMLVRHCVVLRRTEFRTHDNNQF